VGRFFFNWAVMALALWATAWILPGVHVSSTAALAVGALVLGFVNAVIRPILTLLTLPVTAFCVSVLFWFVGSWGEG